MEKCAGTGVVLAVALVHMVLPSHLSLRNPCAPIAFNSDYIAYAFSFALTAGLVMHFIDFLLGQYPAARQSVLASDPPFTFPWVSFGIAWPRMDAKEAGRGVHD